MGSNRWLSSQIRMESGGALFRLVLGLLNIVLLFILILGFLTPDVSWLRDTNPSKTAMMSYREEGARNALEPFKIHYDFVPLSGISRHLQDAVIVNEDLFFYNHQGFDWKEIGSVIQRNLREGRIIGGGSTITQQLAKNLFLKPARSFVRKIREAWIALKLEKELSKPRILELYLNVIEMGPGIYGAEAASQAYFKKSASELSLEEAVRLAAILPNPHRFSSADTDLSPQTLSRRLKTARKLFRYGRIDKADYQELKRIFLNK